MIHLTKPCVLIFTAFYKPGFKGGGPIKSVYNIVSSLCDSFNFDIVTLDRDLNETEPYINIKQNEWNKMSDSIRVYYYSPDKMNIGTFYKICRNSNYDIIYLNSLYNKQTVYLTLLNKFNLIKGNLIIAPRGEVEDGAISIKKNKKILFLKLNSLINLYKNITWHATNIQEKNDIKKYINTNKIYVAENIPDAPSTNNMTIKKDQGFLKLVFLSRISTKKNILLSLKALKGVHGKIIFDIYGPIEDHKYYTNCKYYAETLPSNICVNFKGGIEPNMVTKTLSKYHFFIFPTLGENYGHVIYEALSACVPIITTKSVPKNDLKEKGMGFNLGYSIQEWAETIQYCINLNQSEYNSYTINLLDNNRDIHTTRKKSIKDTKRFLLDNV